MIKKYTPHFIVIVFAVIGSAFFIYNDVPAACNPPCSPYQYQYPYPYEYQYQYEYEYQYPYEYEYEYEYQYPTPYGYQYPTPYGYQSPYYQYQYQYEYEYEYQYQTPFPGDFSINCQVAPCPHYNNDRIECRDKETNPWVDFTWSQSSGATSYEVYFKTYSIGGWGGPVATTDANNRRYVANVGLNSQNYYYIKAINSGGFKSCSIHVNGGHGACLPANQNNPNDNDGAEANCELPPPSVDVTCGGLQSCTIPWNSPTTIGWSVGGVANSCSASGDWGGSKSTGGGSQGTGNLTQVKTYQYTLTCSGPGGNNSDTVNVTVSAPVPNNPSNVSATPPDYCASGPAVTVGWSYSDPSGSPQQSYQVQVDNDPGFGSPEVDSGKVNSGSNSYFSGQGLLQFNTTYRVRVRVWNGYDSVSGWTTGPGTFSTPPYAYPQANFTWTSNGIAENPSPPIGKVVQFTDQTGFSGPPAGRTWNWNFGDGSPFSTLQNPTKVYNTEGTYYVTLAATDNAGQICYRTRGPLLIQKPIPLWREIAPR